MELSRSKYYQWRDRYGKANEHNVLVPRDHWIERWEKDAIIDFHHQFPLEGYHRLTFMMLDRDIVAVSPSSTYRVLKDAGLLDSWKPKPSFKGTGFVQPLSPHEHWHVDTFDRACTVILKASCPSSRTREPMSASRATFASGSTGCEWEIEGREVAPLPQRGYRAKKTGGFLLPPVFVFGLGVSREI